MFHVLIFFFQSEFCSDKPKSGAKYGLPDSLAILSEMGEVTEGMMDTKVNTVEMCAVVYSCKCSGDVCTHAQR